MLFLKYLDEVAYVCFLIEAIISRNNKSNTFLGMQKSVRWNELIKGIWRMEESLEKIVVTLNILPRLYTKVKVSSSHVCFNAPYNYTF